MRRKKLLLSILFVLAFCFTVNAQAPTTGTVEFDKISYSGLYSSAKVIVKDQDLNLNQFVQNKTSVKITSDADSRGIILELSETGLNTGIFSGSLKFSTAASNGFNGVIKIGASSRITAEYTDLANSENLSNRVASSQAAFSFTEAVVKTTAENDFGTGNMVDIIIIEPDINNPDRIDAVTAKVSAGSSTDNLTVRLEETDINTGEFRQTVWFTDRDSNRNLLFMSGMDKVNIKYIDQTVPQGGAKEIVKTIGWEYQSTVITLDKESYAGYNTSAEITLYNMELNNHSDKAESVYVDVETSNSKEMRLELKETKKSSGIFTETLYFGRSTDKEDNIIKMTGMDAIFVTYINTRDKSDIAQCSADWSPQDGKLTLNRQVYSGNSALVTVTLEDWDVAERLSVNDRVNVIARVPGTSRKKSITLEETRRDSGIFEKTFYINSDSGQNPSIDLNPGEIIEIEYKDEDTTSGSEETRKANAVWTGVSKPELTLDRTIYKGYGTFIGISLKDPDFNKKENVRESVEILVKTSGNMNGARYVLKETDADTGIFTASLGLSQDTSNFSNVKVADTDKITVTLVDKNVSVTADFSK